MRERERETQRKKGRECVRERESQKDGRRAREKDRQGWTERAAKNIIDMEK